MAICPNKPFLLDNLRPLYNAVRVFQEKAANMEFSTAEIANHCGVSLKSVNNWAAKNGVQKQGRYWAFSADDVKSICEYYSKEPLEESKEPFTEGNEESEAPNEASNEGNEERKKLDTEAKEDTEESREAIEEVYEAMVASLKEEISSLREQLKTKDDQINNLIETSREISAAHAITAATKEGTGIVLAGKESPSRLDYLKAFFTGKVGK